LIRYNDNKEEDMMKKILVPLIIMCLIALVIIPTKVLSANSENPFQGYRDSFFTKYCNVKPTKDPILGTICWLLIEKEDVATSKTLYYYDSSTPNQRLGLFAGNNQLYSEELGLMVRIDNQFGRLIGGGVLFSGLDCTGDAYTQTDYGQEYYNNYTFLFPAEYTDGSGAEHKQYYKIENPSDVVSLQYQSFIQRQGMWEWDMKCINVTWEMPPQNAVILTLIDIPPVLQNYVLPLWVGTE